MRVLFVHDNGWICQSLAEALERKGHFGRVIAWNKFSTDWPFGPRDWSLGSHNVETADTYKIIPTLRSIIANKDVDLINSNNYTSWVAAEIFRRITGVPHIITLHGSDLRNLIRGPMFAPKRRFLFGTLKACSMILATTPDLLTHSALVGKEILHLPQPINTGIFNDHAPKNNSLSGDPMVFSPTRLQEIKDPKKIIEILVKIVEEYPLSHIYQVKWGAPEYSSMLSNRISSRNLTFIWIVPRNQLPSWYVTADIVIGQMGIGILSNIELEAMSCKTPVVAYDKYYGYGCESRDVGSAFRTACKIVSDCSFRRRLIEKGSRIIDEKHDVNRVADLYLTYARKLT